MTLSERIDEISKTVYGTGAFEGTYRDVQELFLYASETRKIYINFIKPELQYIADMREDKVTNSRIRELGEWQHLAFEIACDYSHGIASVFDNFSYQEIYIVALLLEEEYEEEIAELA